MLLSCFIVTYTNWRRISQGAFSLQEDITPSDLHDMCGASYASMCLLNLGEMLGGISDTNGMWMGYSFVDTTNDRDT